MTSTAVYRRIPLGSISFTRKCRVFCLVSRPAKIGYLSPMRISACEAHPLKTANPSNPLGKAIHVVT